MEDVCRICKRLKARSESLSFVAEVMADILQDKSSTHFPSGIWQIYVGGYTWETLGYWFQRSA